MQPSAPPRKKKVETYDGEIDFFAPAIAQPTAPQAAMDHAQHGAEYLLASAPFPQPPSNITGKIHLNNARRFNDDQSLSFSFTLRS
jgi:hypothetical protein